MPRLRHPAPAALVATALVALATPATGPAHAQVRRCTTPDGGTIYTDRSCPSLGAVETRQAHGAAGGPTAALRYRGGCARRLQDLVFEVTAAIDARDTNWLSRSYHWAGMGHSSGYAVLERLDAIAHRPLLNVTALRPAQTVHVPAATPSGFPGEATFPALATPPPASPPSRRPVALRVDQVLADGTTPSTTTFGLRRHMDCWWISL